MTGPTAAGTLLLGEGNFSFALSCARADRTARITATTYDSKAEAERKYDGNSNALALEELGGLVVYGVDATLDHAFDGIRDVFSRVEFRYPHTGTKSLAANRTLLERVLRSVATLLRSPRCTADAEFLVTCKTTGRYNDCYGDLRALAPPGLLLAGVTRAVAPIGYTHATTTARTTAEGLDHAATWAFRVAADADAAPTRGPLPRWLREELAQRSPRCELCDKVFTTAGDLEKHEHGRGHRGRVVEARRRARQASAKLAATERKRKRNDGEVLSGELRRCESCGVDCNSEASWKMHTRGKRHLQRAALEQTSPPCPKRERTGEHARGYG